MPRQFRLACATDARARRPPDRPVGQDERANGQGFALHAALMDAPGLICLTLPLDAEQPAYPSISDIFPTANRMQRAVYDLLGIVATDSPDTRKWLRHGAWPEDVFPLRKEFDLKQQYPLEDDAYPFVTVTGDGVHEIPVGTGACRHHRARPFPFFHHRRARAAAGRTPGLQAQGHRKAGRNHDAWNRARNWPGAFPATARWPMPGPTPWQRKAWPACTPEPRAMWLRALLLERERIANHLGDLGYLGNDVALAFGFAQFWRLKEDWLRDNQTVFGHRYLMDSIVPGGVT